MQFNTWSFLFVFLPIMLLGYFLLNKYLSKRGATYFLIAGNLFFYGYSSIKCLMYFICCVLINYVIARCLIIYKKRKVFILGLILNLGTLGILKYYNFFLTSFNSFFNKDYNLIHLFLPLGISFFSFQFIALLYDCYKGKIEELSFAKYVLFSTFFPKIVQGPIMLYQEFDVQYNLEVKEEVNAENLSKGLYALALGFGKKILIADVLALFVNPGFESGYSSYNSTMLILLMLIYTLQIYFDFSAYTDMARGISFVFNIELPQNFNSPYKATNVNSFWKRWHMSLTNFFTRYLYIPLGGNRKGEIRTYINVIIVFVLSGLWHGANYTFIVWGLLHGLASAAERKWKFPEKLHIVLQWLYTFAFVNVAWLFFRAGTVTQAIQIIKGILKCNFTGIDTNALSVMILPEIRILFEIFHIEGFLRLFPLAFIFILLIGVLQGKNTDEKIVEFKPTYKKAILIIVLMSWSILSFGSKTTFIYEMF